MRIISKKPLTIFTQKHPQFKSSIEAWHGEVKSAKWEKPKDVIERYPKASNLSNGRIVFRKGGGWRLVVKIHYVSQIVYICFIGTHEEYDKIDAKTIWNH